MLKNKPDFVKIGDIVCIEFIEQIFEGLKEYAKIEGGQENLRLARILEKPDIVYKGVIFSDGVVDKNFKVIPKNIRIGADMSFTSAEKSIFRIEVEQEYKFTQHYFELQGETVYNEMAEFENPDEEEEMSIIYQDILKKYKKELKSNSSEQKFHNGKNLLYGQVIQFRHIASGLFLTLENKKLSSEYGCFELKLSSSNEYSRFKLMPSIAKTKVLSESVEYEDNFIIQNVEESTGYYIHCDSSDLYSEEQNEDMKDQAKRHADYLNKIMHKTISVNASHGDASATKWRFSRYMSYDYNENNKDSINTTDIVRFYHREMGGYLTVTRRDVESNLPEYPDFLKKEIAILAEEKDDLEDDEEEDVVIDEGKVEQEILIYIEKDQNKLDKTNTLWEIQRIETFIGGNLTTNEKYLIRHVGTGMYLSASDHIELSLTKDGNALENEFSFKNETLQEQIKSSIPDKSLICIQNLDEKYIQTYTDSIKEEFNYVKSRNNSSEVPIV